MNTTQPKHSHSAGAPLKMPAPFKQITTANLKRLCLELPPAALKVFLYYLSLTGKPETSFARNETVATATDLNLETAKKAKKWLVDRGWLVKCGLKKLHGRLTLPIFRCTIPQHVTVGGKSTHRQDDAGRKIPPGTVGGKSTHRSICKDFEVDAASGRRFSNSGEPTTAPDPAPMLAKQMQIARNILVREDHLDPDLVTIALLRVADLNRALKTRVRSPKAHFVKSVRNNILGDEDEKKKCQFICEERRRSGVPMNAPLRPDEWPDKSKIVLIHESVEVAARDGRRATEVRDEMLAAIMSEARQ